MANGASSSRATIHDVAARAGVSAATVSKVLRGVTSVKADNAQRVRQAVADLNYRVDPLASGLRQERRRIIGAVVPDLESEFFGALATALEQAAEDAGYNVIIASSRESEDREADLVARMDDWRVAGTVLAPVRSERGAGAATLARLGMTAVLVDRVSAGGPFDTVTADNFEASAHVAEQLWQAGHRHVLLHGATTISKSVRTRVEGFAERARTLEPAMTIDTLLSDEALDAQRLAVRDYLKKARGERTATAVFSLSQHSTLLVLSEMRRLGIACPQDMALVGFDDAEWMQTTWPSISAVAQPVRTIAGKAVSALLSRLDGGPGLTAQHLEPCRLIMRESFGASGGQDTPGDPLEERTHPRA